MKFGYVMLISLGFTGNDTGKSISSRLDFSKKGASKASEVEMVPLRKKESSKGSQEIQEELVPLPKDEVHQLRKNESSSSIASTSATSGSNTSYKEIEEEKPAVEEQKLALEEEKCEREKELEKKEKVLPKSFEEKKAENLKYQEKIKEQIEKIQARRTSLENSLPNMREELTKKAPKMDNDELNELVEKYQKDLDERRFYLESEKDTLQHYLKEAQEELSNIEDKRIKKILLW